MDTPLRKGSDALIPHRLLFVFCRIFDFVAVPAAGKCIRMISYLIRRFIPNADQVQDTHVRSLYGTLSGCLGIFFNFLLFLSKLLAGMVSGSLSLIADAMNNLSDAGSSIATLIGFRLASQKADAAHPFGHGRIEYLSGLFIAVAILLVGVELVRESFSKILHPEATLFHPVLVAILVLSILVKLYMYRYNHLFAQRLQSVALQSAAEDSRNDCITTSVVLASLLAQHFTGLVLDGWSGLAVAVFILVSGIRSILETISPLLGQEADPVLVEKISDRILETPGVLGLHDLIIHDYGPGTRMMTLHLELPATLSLPAAHQLADQLENSLQTEFGIQTVIHVDPIAADDAETAQLREKLSEFLDYLGPGFLYHDFRVVHEKDRTRVLFDVNLPFGIRMTDEEVLDYLKKKFAAVDPKLTLRVGVDHYTRP